jgi:protein RecA
MSVQEKKNKSISEAIRAIHKQFGSGSIMRLDGSEVQPVEVIPTGSVALDVALGCGGLPRGRIIEIYGPESSGKTTLTLHAIAEAQRSGGVCAFLDAEHALDTDYARRLGVDLEDLLVSQPDCARRRAHGAPGPVAARTHLLRGVLDGSLHLRMADRASWRPGLRTHRL